MYIIPAQKQSWYDFFLTIRGYAIQNYYYLGVLEIKCKITLFTRKFNSEACILGETYIYFFNLVEISKQLDKCDEKEKRKLNKIDLDRFLHAKPAVIKLF